MNSSPLSTRKFFGSKKLKCKFDGRKCNLNQKWNNDKCRFECKISMKHLVSTYAQGMNPLKLRGLENLEVVYFSGAELFGNSRGEYH